MANRYWVGGTANWDGTAGTKWALTSGGAGGQAVPTSSDDVFFDAASGANTVTISGTRTCLSLNATGFTGTLAGTSTPVLNINGSLTLDAGMTVAGTLTNVNFVGAGSHTITTNGKSLVNVTFNNAGDTWTLQDNLTATGTVTLTAGTLALSSYTLTAASFTNTSTTTREINFGTGKLVLTGSGTVFNGVITGFTTSGTTKIVEPSLGAAQTITPGALLEANAFDISVPATAGNFTLTLTAGGYHDLTFANATYTVANTALSVYGNLSIAGTSPTFTAGTNAWTFASAAATQTITTNGETLDFPITINGANTTVQLQDALTVASGRTVTLTDGTLDLQSYTFTTGLFASNNSNSRTIAFGTGKITLTGSGTVWNSATATNLTTTGTTRIVEPALGANQTITPGTPTEANTFDISVPVTAGNFTLTITGADNVRNLSFANATYTVANTAIIIYGNVLISGTSPTFTAGTNAWTFSSAASTQQITTNGKTLDFPITINGADTTFQLQDALTIAPTRILTLSDGTLDLQSYTLTLGRFVSTGSVTRTIAFGTGKMFFNGTADTTAWDTASFSNLTITGGREVEATAPSSGNTKNFDFGPIPEASALNFTVVTGGSTGTVEIDNSVNNLTLQNDTYEFALSGATSIYGNLLINGTSPTIIGSTTVLSFAATSGTKTITTNGSSADFTIAINGVGGTFQIEDAFTGGSTRSFTLTNGTLNLQSYTLTVGSFLSNNTNNRTLNFGTGKVLITGTATSTIIATNFTVTGTKLIERSSSGTMDFDDGWTESNSLDLSLVSGGTGTTTITGYLNNLSIGSFTRTIGSTTNIRLFGDLFIAGSGITWAVTTAEIFFAGNTGTKLITTNGVSIGSGMRFEGTATFQLQSAVTLYGNATDFSRLNLIKGTLDLNDYTFTAVRFATTGTDVRSIDFGTGKIVLTQTSPSAPTSYNIGVSMSSLTNYSVSGNNLFEFNSGYVARTLTDGNATNAPNINMNGGGWLVLAGSVNNFTSSGGTIERENTVNVYGDMTFSGSPQFLLNSSNASPRFDFISTSGTKTITTNGVNVDADLRFDGIGGTWSFADNFNQSLQSSLASVNDLRRITLLNGTLEFNNQIVSVNSFISTEANTRVLDFTGGGELRIIGTDSVYTGTRALMSITTNAQLTVVSPSEGILSTGTSGDPKTFSVSGGTSTTLPTIVQRGSGTLTIDDWGNTGVKIYNLGKDSVSRTITFDNGRTYTFENFGVTPNVGTTLTLASSSPGSTYTFSQASGTISNQRLIISDSTATGGATWYAGSTSTDGGNNTGWIFADAPAASGNMLMLFM
jgi:hypothetical protein